MQMRALGMRGVCAVVFIVAIALGACGREQVVQLEPDADGGLPDASFASDGPQDDASTRPCDIVDGGPREACRGNGATCQGASDCCSSRCEGNICLAAGTCGGPGTTCSKRDDCCSGQCEPSPGGRKCLNYCLADGASCASPQDCCSLACNGGACGGALCAREDTICTSDADCCSANCAASVDGGAKKCRAAGSCKGTGDECDTTECCSQKCTTDGGVKRCDPGPGACRPPGSFCAVDGDCCRAPCAIGPSGYLTCSAPPLPDGRGCTSNADCATRICTGVPPVCGAPALQCRGVGTPCNIASDCCTDVCQAGYCASNCVVR
jgi:hypothetical protein